MLPHIELVFGLVEEFRFFRAADLNDLEGIMRAVLAPADVQDRAVCAGPQRAQDLELADFKVRILTGGTDAVTRVLIESHDRKTGRRWYTVGVSPNIVDASFEALLDSIVFKLWTDGIAPSPQAAA